MNSRLSMFQLLFGWTAVSILVTAPWSDFLFVFIALILAGIAIFFNSTSVALGPKTISGDTSSLKGGPDDLSSDSNKTAGLKSRTINRISFVNTVIGWNYSGVAKAFILFLNVVMISIWVFGAIIRSELNTAWGCYSGSLSIDYLTDNTCTENGGLPTECYDIYYGNGIPKPCYGHREAGGAWTQYIPPIFLAVEWTFTAALVLRENNLANK